MRLSVILQKYHFLPIDRRRQFLLVSTDDLTPFQTLIMDNSSCCPPNTQQNLVCVPRSLWRVWYQISRRQLIMILTLRIRIQDPFFVAG
ncbi:unnamed protein product [Acanthoscelides obtectus]|uniref:Uncharacterized protein n=1 Tax=Acanthoscelides obtectus TaxID=200917 RepID=A0A9P0Q4H1_ACAOB|nr:unnamed protein product [Acanthoscelides obtectus]CAK1646573.1 hypothetical protein AOBTE_LOCUS14724 [Acanthoscelides obtectus]